MKGSASVFQSKRVQSGVKCSARMEAEEGTVSAPSKSVLVATVALGALAAGIAFLLYRSLLHFLRFERVGWKVLQVMSPRC